MEKKLDILLDGHAGVMKLRNGDYANYRVIRNEGDRFVYYTGRGIREIFTDTLSEDEELRKTRLNALDERNLIFSRHVAITLFTEIEEIIS